MARNPTKYISGMIILRPKAQFGNILFQYAFARIISLRFGISSIFVDRTFGGKILIELELAKELDVQPELYRVIFKHSTFLDKFTSIWSRFGLNGFSRLIQTESLRVSIPATVMKNVAIHGRFQSPQYWTGYEEIIREEISTAIWKLAGKEESKQIGVLGVHIRRGDYLEERYKYSIGVLDVPFFEEAIRDAISKCKISNIILFSDEVHHPDVVHLKDTFDCEVRSGEWLDDFCGIMECEFKIISNSTFSWWAAFLSEGLDSKKIWTPSPFTFSRSSEKDDDIIPQSWNALQSKWMG